MSQSATRSSLLVSPNRDAKAGRELSLRRKLEALENSEVLAQLRPSERRTALDIVRRRWLYAKLGDNWLDGFLSVIGALKAEEDQCDLD